MAYTTIKKPSDYFNTKLYTGNGSTQSITGVGFQPDFTWIKNRSSGYSHCLYDVARTATKRLKSNSSGAEDTDTNGLTAFDLDGFSVGSSASQNASGENIVAWNWLGANGTASNTDGSITSTVSANTTSGFSIVTYSGDGTGGATVGHGLGVAPAFVIIKSLSAHPWYVWPTGATRLVLDDTAADYGNAPVTKGTTTITLPAGVDNGWNASGLNYVMYCFAEVKGFSKFGSYTGNGNADGPFIYTGFKPAMVILKNTSITGNWQIMDNRRNTYNAVDTLLKPNDTIADQTPSDAKDFLSNGFKLRNSAGEDNGSGNTFIYMAFAEEPLVGDNPATAR